MSSLVVPNYNDFPFLIPDLTVFFFPKISSVPFLLPMFSPFVPKLWEKRCLIHELWAVFKIIATFYWYLCPPPHEVKHESM